MPTVSHIVKKIITQTPYLEEALDKGILNFANLAEYYQGQIEKELGQKVNGPAIVMAFRRHAENIESKNKSLPKFDYTSEIVMKTNLVDICVMHSTAFFAKLKDIYKAIDYDKGDVLNIIHGNNEAIIITNEKHKKTILSILKDEKIINTLEDLASFSLKFNPQFLSTPGIIAAVVKQFAWEDINILELVTTNTEMTFIVQKKDINRTYNVLEALVEKRKK